MTDQKRAKEDLSRACDQSSLERRWGHPLCKFPGDVGFWIAHIAVAIGVVVVILLTLYGVQIHGAWAIVAPAALMVFGYAVLFAFDGWLARSGR